MLLAHPAILRIEETYRSSVDLDRQLSKMLVPTMATG